MSTGHLNHSWGKTIIDQLVKQGVTYFCYAPGFRTTPIALGIAENHAAKKFVHFDERGAAFHALGYAKATGKPAAVIVTSGTAVGNLMPAVMQAWAAHVPMILITCDRPIELRDTMANQTADNIKIFGEYVRTSFDLPSPNASSPQQFLATTIAQAVLRSTYPLAGPVQLNCPFPEPFFEEKKAKALDLPVIEYSLPLLSLSEELSEKWALELQEIEKGVIVLGEDGGCKNIKILAEKLGWPIFPDLLSNYRQSGDERIIPYYHHILKTFPDSEADAVLYFGNACVSKVILQWISKQKKLIHITPHYKRCDPLHAVSHRIICDPSQFCEKVATRMVKKKNEWLPYWIGLGKNASPSIETKILSEPAVPTILEKIITPRIALFLGNGMPVRDAEMFFFPDKPCGPIFGNRGLSGIDGNIATIAGIAEKYPVIGVIGDQAVLHDLNSLVQLKKTKYPVKLIAINNGGGGIFSFVSVHDRKDVLDSYFAGAHTMTFEKAADFFELPYALAKTDLDLLTALEGTEPCFIEVRTDREENLLLHQEIDQQIKNALCSSFSMVS